MPHNRGFDSLLNYVLTPRVLTLSSNNFPEQTQYRSLTNIFIIYFFTDPETQGLFAHKNIFAVLSASSAVLLLETCLIVIYILMCGTHIETLHFLKTQLLLFVSAVTARYVPISVNFILETGLCASIKNDGVCKGLHWGEGKEYAVSQV